MLLPLSQAIRRLVNVCRTEKTLDDAKVLTRSTSPGAATLHHKVLDLRKVRAIIRDLTYLSGEYTVWTDCRCNDAGLHENVVIPACDRMFRKFSF